MTEEIKDCAHCGNNPNIINKDINAYSWYSIECNCGMKTSIYSSKELAKKVWNTRKETKCE